MWYSLASPRHPIVVNEVLDMDTLIKVITREARITLDFSTGLSVPSGSLFIVSGLPNGRPQHKRVW